MLNGSAWILTKAVNTKQSLKIARKDTRLLFKKPRKVQKRFFSQALASSSPEIWQIYDSRVHGACLGSALGLYCHKWPLKKFGLE